MSDTRTPLLNSAIFLAGATAFLYCMSTARSNKYLRVLGLDPDILDRNFHQVLYDGLIVSLKWLLIVPIVYCGAYFLYRFIVRCVTDWSRTSFGNRRRLVGVKHHFFGKRKSTNTEILQNKRLVRALGYAVISIVFLKSMVYAESQGGKLARALLDQIEQGKAVQVSSIIQVKIEDLPKKSLLNLGCGARNCAGIDLTTKIVYYFPQNGHSYQFKAPSTPP